VGTALRGAYEPAVTLTYFALGKIRGGTTAFYVAAQFGGAIAGVGVSSLLLGFPLGDNAVNFAATLAGTQGPWTAFAAELAISAVMMFTILTASNRSGDPLDALFCRGRYWQFTSHLRRLFPV